jgi:hypothetical protein
MEYDIAWRRRSSDISTDIWTRCFAPPRLGLFWFRALEAAHLDDQFTFFYGLLQRNGLGIGIIPAFVFRLPLELVISRGAARTLGLIARGRLAVLRYVRVFFIGNVAGEEGCIGLQAGVGLKDVVRCIHTAACDKASELQVPLVVWKDFPEGDRLQLDIGLAKLAFRVPSYPGTAVPLCHGGFDTYLRSVSSNRRWKLKTKLRRGKLAIPVHATLTTLPSELEMARIFDLFWQTYQRGTTKFERLNLRFFQAIARSPEAAFVLLREPSTDRIVAFMLVLQLGERVINQFIGLDYSMPKQGFLYFRLFAAAYDFAAATSAKTMQSGQTGYRAKFELGHRLIPLWSYCTHRNKLVQWALSKIASRISWETLDEDLRVHLRAHAVRPSL